MGRKAKEKEIDVHSAKRRAWAKEAFPFFQKMGIKGFKMDKLAEMLGKSKTTIYKHFVSREDLVGLVIEMKLEELAKFEKFLTNKDLDYIDRYENAINLLASVLQGITNKFLLEVSEVYPIMWDDIQKFRQRASLQLDHYYRKGTELGHFRDINPGVLILTDRLFFEAVLSQEFLVQKEITMGQAFKDYFKLKCFGMVSSTRP